MRKLFTLLLVCFTIYAFGASVNVSFKLKAINEKGTPVDTTKGVYIVGDVTKWAFKPMEKLSDHVYIFDTSLNSGDTLSFYFILVNSWDSAGNQNWNYYKKYREYPDTANTICNPSFAKWKGDRWLIVPKKDTTIYVQWGKCELLTSVNESSIAASFNISPNPSNGIVNITFQSVSGIANIDIIDLTGKTVKSLTTSEKIMTLDLSGLQRSVYLIKVSDNTGIYTRKLIIR